MLSVKLNILKNHVYVFKRQCQSDRRLRKRRGGLWYNIGYED